MFNRKRIGQAEDRILELESETIRLHIKINSLTNTVVKNNEHFMDLFHKQAKLMERIIDKLGNK